MRTFVRYSYIRSWSKGRTLCGMATGAPSTADPFPTIRRSHRRTMNVSSSAHRSWMANRRRRVRRYIQLVVAGLFLARSASATCRKAAVLIGGPSNLRGYRSRVSSFESRSNKMKFTAPLLPFLSCCNP